MSVVAEKWRADIDLLVEFWAKNPRVSPPPIRVDLTPNQLYRAVVDTSLPPGKVPPNVPREHDYRGHRIIASGSEQP